MDKPKIDWGTVAVVTIAAIAWLGFIIAMFLKDVHKTGAL